jgi:UDP-glucose 4-epimerase
MGNSLFNLGTTSVMIIACRLILSITGIINLTLHFVRRIEMKSVVFGGHGFIGAEIVRALLHNGVSVTVADKSQPSRRCDQLFGYGAVRSAQVDILDASSLRQLTEGVDRVYHLAGKLGTSELDDDVVQGINVNIIGAVNVFAACVENRVPIVFYPSKPNVWLNTYTITKHAAERFAQLYSRSGETTICSLRYFNAYGPYQASGPVRKIIPCFAQRAMRGLPIEIFGDGEQVVDMIFSADLARITVDFTEVAQGDVPLDCGRGIGLTVNEVAHAVNRFFGNAAGVRHVPMRRGETPGTRLVANIDPLRKLLGDLSFTSWESSLAATLQWYETQETNLHKRPPLSAAVVGAA